MTNTEKAIQLAKKGGWKPKKDWHYEDHSEFGIKNIIWELERCFLDPLFWKSLGYPNGMILMAEHITNKGGTPESFFRELK